MPVANFYLIPRIGGLAYLNLPKAACTSILLALSKMRTEEGFAPPQHPSDGSSHPIHGFQPASDHLAYFFARWPHDWPPLPASLVRFSFVRNPFDRLLSFYKSKIEQGQSPVDFYRRFAIKPGCSFADCVTRLVAIDPAELEHHAAPQSLILCDGNEMRVDFVGKVEQFAADWRVIQRLSGFDIDLGTSNSTRRLERPVYTEPLRQAVYEYYRDDFQLFGYAADSVEQSKDELDLQSIPVFTGHHCSLATIDHLKQALAESGDRTRALAESFEQCPERRAKFFAYQHEIISELLNKRCFHTEQKIRQLEIDNAKLHDTVDRLSARLAALSTSVEEIKPRTGIQLTAGRIMRKLRAKLG